MKNHQTFTSANRRAQQAGRDMLGKHADWYQQHTAQGQFDHASAPGCSARLAWIVRNMIGWALLGVIIALFLTHGSNDPKAVEAIQSFAYVGTVVGFWIGIIFKPK